MKALILGGSSYIGRHLFEKLGTDLAVATYFKTPIPHGVRFDVLSTRLSEIVAAPETFSHALIMLGNTSIDSCASDVEASHALNVESIERIIDYLNNWGIKPVFTSTDMVFNGVMQGNYMETDPTSPVITYGQQKAEIENYIKYQCPRYTIVRLGKVYGSQRGDGTLFTGWLDQMNRGETIYCAHDQIFSPIHVSDVVRLLIWLMEVDLQGTYHLAGPEAHSRLDLINILVTELANLKPFELRQMKANIAPCSIHDFDMLERRPLNVSIKTSKVLAAAGVPIKPVREMVRQMVAEMPLSSGG